MFSGKTVSRLCVRVWFQVGWEGEALLNPGDLNEVKRYIYTAGWCSWWQARQVLRPGDEGNFGMFQRGVGC